MDDQLPDDEIATRYEQILARFRREHEKRTRPYRYSEGFTRRISGACRHLRDQIRVSAITHITAIEAHLWSNMLGCAFCLACSRQAKHIEKFMCGICGLPNPYREGHYRAKDRACSIATIYEPPLSLHIPLCRTCEQILASYLARRDQIGPNVA